MSRKHLYPLGLLLLLGFRCDKTTEPTVATVTVALSNPSIFTGQTTTATAELKDVDGNAITGRSVEWASSTQAVATVNATGVVTAVRAGASLISATIDGKTGSASLTVLAPVSTVEVALAASSIAPGATTQATAILKDAEGNTLTGRTVAWSSASTTVATVNSSTGVVTGVGAGTTAITASAEGKTGSANVTVIPPAPGAFSLSAPANRSANNSTTPTFTWSSSSGAVSYTLEVATASGFGAANVISQAGITGTTFTPTTALQTGTIYFWRVTAVNTGGSTVAANGTFEFSAPMSAGRDPAGIAITPDGTRAYVVNSANPGTVTVLSLTTKQVITTIPIGSFGGQIAMRPDGAQAVASQGNALAVIDVSTNTVTKTIPMPCVGTTLYDLAYSPDGTKVLLPDLGNGCTQEGVRIVTIASGATQFVDLAKSGPGIAVTSDGATAIITLGILGTAVKRVNLSTLAVSTISGTGSTFGVAITPDNGTAVIAASQSESIKRLDLATGVVSSSANFGSNASPHNVAITPDGTKAVIVGDFTTAVIQLSSNSVLATYPNGGSTVSLTPDGRYALITTGAGSGTSGTVRVIRIP